MSLPWKKRQEIPDPRARNAWETTHNSANGCLEFVDIFRIACLRSLIRRQ